MQYRMSVYALAISLSLTANFAQAASTAINMPHSRAVIATSSSEHSVFVLEEMGNSSKNEHLSQQINTDWRPSSVENARVLPRNSSGNGNMRPMLRPDTNPLLERPQTSNGTIDSRPNTPANSQGTPQVDSAPTTRNYRPDTRLLGQPLGTTSGTTNSRPNQNTGNQSTPQIDSVPANTNVVSDRPYSRANLPASNEGTPQIDSAPANTPANTNVVSDRPSSRPNQPANSSGTPQIDSVPAIGTNGTTNSMANTPAYHQGTQQIDSVPTIDSMDDKAPRNQQIGSAPLSEEKQSRVQQLPDARINPKNPDITCNYKPSPGQNIPGSKTGDITCDLKPSYREGISTYADRNAGSIIRPGGEDETGEWRPIVVPPGASGRVNELKPSTDNTAYGSNGIPRNPGGNAETGEWRPIVVPPRASGQMNHIKPVSDSAAYGSGGRPINPGGNVETGEWRPIVVPPGSSGPTSSFSTPQDNASYGVVGYPLKPGGNVETGEWRPIVVPPGATGPTGYEATAGKSGVQIQCNGVHPTDKGGTQILCNGVHPTDKGETQIQCNGFRPSPGKLEGNPAGAIQLQCNEKGNNIPVVGSGNNNVPQVQLPNQNGSGIIACNFRPKDNIPLIPVMDTGYHEIPQVQMPNGALDGKGMQIYPGSNEGQTGGEYMHYEPGFMK